MIKEELIEQIESLRRTMISVGMSQGFTSTETIRLSKTLDELLNQWVVSV
ncbi:Spo0E family sporulation regulatory protein-aspartic acid phosphatase [Neobacillus sp. NPDC093182]